MKVDTKKLIVYLPDTRGTTISQFGSGNLKIGPNVFTYSRLPGLPSEPALGMEGHYFMDRESWLRSEYVVEGYEGTCPGATDECRAVCYAARPVAENGPVNHMWWLNSRTEEVPAELPPDCRLLRLHISGDFTSEKYIDGWTSLLSRHPHVTVWAYTRSWRVPALLPALERLRALPNVQLFASMDKSCEELPPSGWRRAWIEGDERAEAAPIGQVSLEGNARTYRTVDGATTFLCPEETGHQPNCESCGYCLRGRRGDVTFLLH
jgi:hypothetical protein